MTINHANGVNRVLPWSGGVDLRDLPAHEAEQRVRVHIPWTTEPRPSYQQLDDGTFRPTPARDVTIVHPDPTHPDHLHVLRHSRGSVEDFQPEDLIDLAALLVNRHHWRWEAVCGTRELVYVILAPAIFAGGVDGDTAFYTVLGKDYRTGRSCSATVTPVHDPSTTVHHVRGLADTWPIPNLHNDPGKAAAADKTVKAALIAGSRFTAAMRKLAGAPMTSTQFGRLCEALVPAPTARKHHADMLATLMESPHISRTQRRTRYGAFCAVTEWMDWTRAGLRGGGDRMTRLNHPTQAKLRARTFKLLSQGL